MRAAILQMTSGIDPVENANAIVAAVKAAKMNGADMLFTPEMAGLLDRNRQRVAEHLVREADNLVLAAVRAAAAKEGLWVHIGSLGLLSEREDGKWVNRSFVIDDEGEIRARYDKIHLFDVDLPTGESWRESSVYAAGESVVAVDTPWGVLGLTVCYDLRFPDLFRTLSDAGAKILLVPAAFTVPTGEAHWHLMLRARAVEALAFVIAPAQCGDHADGRSTFGHSLAVDPWGEVLLDMGTDAGLGFVDLDLSRIEKLRAQLPAISHRKSLPPVTML